MDAISAAMSMNLQSIQQAISMTTLQKAMNVDASGATAVIEALEQANPIAPPSAHIIDTLA